LKQDSNILIFYPILFELNDEPFWTCSAAVGVARSFGRLLPVVTSTLFTGIKNLYILGIYSEDFPANSLTKKNVK
jgi:hypothetical protein